MGKFLICFALVAAATALSVQPTLRVARPLAVSRRAPSPCALLPPATAGVGLGSSGAFGVAAADSLSQVDMPSTLLAADLIEVFQGFADSPAILLIPIGAGALVAALIVTVLVKSAG